MKTQLKQGKRVYHKSGTPLFEAWLNALCNNEMFIEEINVYKNFKWYSKQVYCFEHKGKTYTECGIDHFNAHMSNFRDDTNIYGVYLRKIEKM